MITLFYCIGDGEIVFSEFETQKEREKFCDAMDKKYEYRGWDIVHEERC